MGSKGSQTTQASSTQTSSADPRAAAVYADILQRAEAASQQGYQPYTGQQVAGFSPDQLAAMQGVSGIQGTYQPMLNQAAQYATAAGQPISASQINAAMSPYIQGVINPTLDIMSTQQAQEMSKLRGTEAQQGAFGGTRSAVAEANLANQQLQAKNQMVAGLMQQGYSQAVAQAQADRLAAGQAAGISTGVASAEVGTPLQALGAELQTGGLQQQLQQAQLNVPYQQYLQAQAYPYQQLSWLSGIAGGIGPGLGGTSSGQSTSVATPAQPSALSQILGGGLALGLAPFTGGSSLAALPGIVARSATGGRINKADGGSVGMGDIDVASTMARALQLADAEMAQPAQMADGGAVGSDGDNIVQGALRMAQAMKRHLGGGASHMADGGVPGATLGTIDVGGKKIVSIFPASSGRGATLHAPNVSYAQSGSIKTPDYGETIKGLGAAFKQPEKSAQAPTPAQMSDGTIAGEAGAFSANIPTPTFSPVSFQESFGYASGGLVPHHAQYGGPMFDPTPLEQQAPDNLVSAEEPAPITGETIPLPRARPVPKQSDTFSRMLRQESGGQQFDRSGQPLTSPKGAIGIAQIMPGTAPEAAQLAGLEYDPERLRNDAEYNKALGQAYYNKQLGDFGGNEQLAAAAYNAGPGRVRQALARAQQEGGSYLNYLPTETQKYVANVVGEAPTGQEALAFSGEPQPYSARIMANAIADLQGQRPEGGPLPYTGEEGLVPAPTPQQTAKADRAASIFERLTGIELSPEARQGLMAMGLRMMTTPGSVGTALGAGGLQGISTYTEAQRYGQEMALKERQRQAEEKRVTETERHQRAMEAETARFHQQSLRAPKVYTDPDTGEQHAIMSAVNPDGTLNWFDQNLTKGTTSPIAAPTAQSTSTEPTVVPAPNKENIPKPGQGTIQNNQELVEKGNYDYRKDAPFIEKGMDVPEPLAIGGRSINSLKTDAEKYVMTGQLPTVKGGASPVAMRDTIYRNSVQNYGNALAASRGFTPAQLAEAHRSAPGMLRFIMGADGRATVSLGTAIRHLDTIKQLAEAWSANDTQTVNRIRTALSREFGKDAGTNLNAAGSIVGPEIIKAIGVAGAGTKEEREHAGSQFSTAASPQQLLGAVETTQKLMAGQLEGRMRQAKAAGVPEQKFIELIGERPYEILSRVRKEEQEHAENRGTVKSTPAEKTIARQGTVTSGPNKGKRLIEYSDGTKEYK